MRSTTCCKSHHQTLANGSTFWKELTKQAIGIFVCPTLPWNKDRRKTLHCVASAKALCAANSFLPVIDGKTLFSASENGKRFYRGVIESIVLSVIYS